MAEDQDALYDACEEVAMSTTEKMRKIFTAEEMISISKDAGIDAISDPLTLLPIAQALCDRALFISMKLKGSSGVCWSLRPKSDAKQVQKLTPEEKTVYGIIEGSHTNGIWVRAIKKQSNLTDQGLNKITERLCKLNLVKSVKNIKSPAQKTFMLFRLAPDDAVTGGSFYDNGDLDENLVDELGNLIVFHVRQAGWVEEKRKKIKRDPGEAITIDDDRDASPEETRGRNKKRKISHTQDIEDAGPARKAHRKEKEETVHVQLSHPAHHEYPDVHNIHHFITNNDFIRASKSSSLTIDEVQNIINMLVWDEKLEPINGGYRTVRGVKMPTMSGHDEDERLLGEQERRGNGLTEMPCGRCPVADVCGKGGPINARSCVYWDEWLGLAVAGQSDLTGWQGQGLEVGG